MSSFVDTVRSLGPARITILGGVFVGLLIFFVFVSAQVSKPSLTLLYGNLSSVDSANVAAKLEEMQIPFEASADGSQIRVPKNEIGRARMVLAQEGLPNGGSMGYEIFDQKNGFGTTSFVQNINQVRALQGELARTISTLDPVDFAKVHLVLPQRELFSRETQSSSASVTLKIKPAARLSREQIYGIQNLVANAVPGLKVDHVSIIDTDANLLAGGESGEAGMIDNAKDESMRRAYEERLNTAIEDMVGRSAFWRMVAVICSSAAAVCCARRAGLAYTFVPAGNCRLSQSAMRAACRSLVSMITRPPGASQSRLPDAMRACTACPSAPPSSATRCSWSRASVGIWAISSVGT